MTLFVRAVQKANWFSFVPISLRNTGGTPNFGIKKNAATLNRSGDYVLNTWFRCQIPLLLLLSDVDPNNVKNGQLRWTRNLMHNLFERIWITFNELMVEEFDNFWLDFNQAFRVRGSKSVGYRNMIGDIGAMTGFRAATATTSQTPAFVGTGGFFQCPFPFWYCEDTGVALPVAALPFNDIRVNYDLRDWQDLVVVDPGTNGTSSSVADVRSSSGVVGNNGAEVSTTVSLGRPEVFSHYAVVHNDERVMMGDAPRDILIKQVQPQRVSPITDPSATLSFDIRGSHAVIAYFFAWRNRAIQDVQQLVPGAADAGAEWSNYTTIPNDGFTALAPGLDPISIATLRYENTPRVSMGSDYYSLTAPWYFSDAIPEDTGYHYYSYGTDTWALDPTGSTNYSKLANVSQDYVASPAAIAATGPSPEDSEGVDITWNVGTPALLFPQKWEHVFHLYNHNIGRVANGSFGHPTL